MLKIPNLLQQLPNGLLSTIFVWCITNISTFQISDTLINRTCRVEASVSRLDVCWGCFHCCLWIKKRKTRRKRVQAALKAYKVLVWYPKLIKFLLYLLTLLLVLEIYCNTKYMRILHCWLVGSMLYKYPSTFSKC